MSQDDDAFAELSSEAMFLDMQVIDELKCINTVSSSDFVSKLFDIFVKDTESKLVKMTAAIESIDLETIDKLAHSLKSSATAVWALQLPNLCKDLETGVGRQGNIDFRKTLLHIQSTYYITHDTIKSVVSRR